MPTYNGARYISEAIESAMCQTYKDLEIIVVDDGSTDNTSEIIHGYMGKDSRIKYFYKQNGGIGSACNFGIARAVGDYIAFFEHDDISFPERLEKQIKILDYNPEIPLVYSTLLIFNNEQGVGGLIGYQKDYKTCRDQFRDIIRRFDFFNNPSTTFRREVWDRFKFNESLPNNNLGHDILFFLQVITVYLTFCIKEPLVKWRRGHISLSSDWGRNFASQVRVIKVLYYDQFEIHGISFSEALSMMYLHQSRMFMYSSVLPNKIRACLLSLWKAVVAKPNNIYIYKNIFGLITPYFLKKLLRKT